MTTGLKQSCDLFIFAGEKSGDLHGGHILHEMRSLHPHLRIQGVGGPCMRSEGLHCVMPMERFQVMGFIDVFVALPRLMRQFYHIKRLILESQPAVVLLIDYPGFNLRLAASLRKEGFKGHICHYICPSVWAWGKQRVGQMARTLDSLFSILPFEKSYFSNTSLPVHYVGHPLVAALRQHKYQPLTHSRQSKLIGLFPGSRRKEIERNLFLQLSAAKKMRESDSTLQFALSVAQPSFLPLIRREIARAGLQPNEVQLLPFERSYDLMRASHLALAKSGTVTLELALHGVPTVVSYGISPLDLFIAQRLLRINMPFYCLVNILADEAVFPELIGPQLSLDTLYQAAKSLLENPVLYADCQEKCAKIQSLLGQEDASQATASHLSSLLRVTTP